MVALGLVTTEHLEGIGGNSGWSLVGAIDRSNTVFRVVPYVRLCPMVRM